MTDHPSLQGIRARFILDDDDLLALAELAKPRLLLLSDLRTPQDLSNEFWAILGEKHGFDSLTVVPDPSTTDRGTILAVPKAQTATPSEVDNPCPTCKSYGFAQSKTNPKQCTFCDGTV